MDQEPKEESSGNIQKQLEEEVRVEIQAFEEETPLSRGEYFGNLEQNFPGGIYQASPIKNQEQDDFISNVNDALLKTEKQRRQIIIEAVDEEESQKPLLEVLKGLRGQFMIKRAESRGTTDGSKLDVVAEEMFKINRTINELLFLPYIELRMKAFTHERITR